MKHYIAISISLLFAGNIHAQINLDALINVYKKSTLMDAKKALQAISDFQVMDSTNTDTIIGKTKEGIFKAYVRNNKTIITFTFIDEALYKKLYSQAQKKFVYTFDSPDGTLGNEISYFDTNFYNYETPKTGSIEVTITTARDIKTEKIVDYKLCIYPLK